jgi:hypothetical protein
MSKGAISVEASRLRRSPKIALHLRHYQRIGVEAGLVTFEGHLSELARSRELAIAHGQIAASVQAEHHRGKVAGFYENQMRLTLEPSDEDLLKEVERLLGKETAEAIGTALRGQ